jgi:drug/metabolite transporter (DMT)-like permease
MASAASCSVAIPPGPERSGRLWSRTAPRSLLLALPFLGRRKAWRSSASGMTWAVAAGLTDVAGLLAFARGGQAGQVAVTAAVSSVYPAIPLLAGLVMFGERLGRWQLIGVTLIIAGLVLIGLG